MYILNQIANEIDSMISLTYDVPSNHETCKMPVHRYKVYFELTRLGSSQLKKGKGLKKEIYRCQNKFTHPISKVLQ